MGGEPLRIDAREREVEKHGAEAAALRRRIDPDKGEMPMGRHGMMRSHHCKEGRSIGRAREGGCSEGVPQGFVVGSGSRRQPQRYAPQAVAKAPPAAKAGPAMCARTARNSAR